MEWKDPAVVALCGPDGDHPVAVQVPRLQPSLQATAKPLSRRLVLGRQSVSGSQNSADGSLTWQICYLGSAACALHTGRFSM